MKPFFILETSLSRCDTQIEPLEPENNGSTKGLNDENGSDFPSGLGDLDDVRTYGHKAERAAALIYAHFKRQFGFPNNTNTSN